MTPLPISHIGQGKAFILMMRLAIFSLMFSALLAATMGAALAAAGPWQGDDGHMRARLITATDSLPEDGQLTAGLEVELKDGWKIYWRSPGDAGLPPELDFSASAQVTAHELKFPAPARFSILGFDSFGYAKRVIYPLDLTITPTSRGMTLVGRLSGLVCSSICVPIDEVLTLSLAPPTTPLTASAEARDLAVFAAQVPSKQAGQGTSRGVTISNLYYDDAGLILGFEKDGMPVVFAQAASADILVEAPSGYSFAPPVKFGNFVQLKSQGKPVSDLQGQPLTLTALAGDWSLESTHIAKKLPATIDVNASLLAIIAVAFLGGLILNIMPCVLPVLSLKLASVIGMGGADRGPIRRSFLATAVGVITSFLMLGAIFAAVRQAGVAVGWGIQFQDPYFLVGSAAAIGLFGLVMLDLITIPIPQFIANGNARRTGLLGDFLSGFLATLLATPCSAPFVGTALTFAFTAPTATMLMVFLAMGIGLAAPWLLVAALPQLAQFLPRPGAWLIQVKRVLAAGLFVTSAWLLSILAMPYLGNTSDDGRWQAWQPDAIPELVANGGVVVVDVTADWCLTCKANKALVLDGADVTAAFAASDAVLMKADWTTPNPAISKFLSDHGRFGIPFDIIYGPARPDGIILPELLTDQLVLDALKAVTIP